MKTVIIITSFLLVGFFLESCSEKESPIEKPAMAQTSSDAEASNEDMVRKGEYLVQIMGCHDCHSPKIMTDHGPEPDPERLLSGHPADIQPAPVADKGVLKDYALFSMDLTSATGPWGTSFSANLTPDETGLGLWTKEQFAKALREGKFKGMDNGRMLLPPMPWQNLRNLKESDLDAIWAYLQSIKPVRNLVPNPVPPMG